ncbi:MAG: hypothetical protein M1834_005020 [Cirrosporium novae-zelandiae]|nr:MAG: hypothetical protein M1834_005020 [Cirrosporium novae-zelandiae]
MKFFIAVAVSSALGALSAPTLHRRDTEAYDVIMTADADITSILAQINLSPSSDDVTQTFNNSAFNGFAGSITAAEASTLEDVSDVLAVSKQATISISATRSNAPWGLERISQTDAVSGSASSLTYTYTYSDTSLGEGVDIYIVDTGINTEHEQFGDRASMGYSYYTSNTDDNGHGTHCSGTAAGSTYGIASNANLIGVKILDSSGSGTSTGCLAGLEYVVEEHNSRSSDSDFVGSVASMSWGFDGRSTSVETVVEALVSAGVHASVAAGNDYGNACSYTPASLGGDSGVVVSVGATNINDEVAYFSNTGSCVDIYAPGQYVISSYIGSDSATAILSGTSMATPHVTGLIAYFLAADSSLSTPALMKSYLTSNAISDALSSGSANIVSGSDLILAYNGGADGF